MAKPGFFLSRLICAATALYFRVSKPNSFVVKVLSIGNEPVTRGGTQWVLVHNRQGCIQHGDIVNKAFGSENHMPKRKASRFVNGYNLATKHFDVFC
jgi:hypothetical protein